MALELVPLCSVHVEVVRPVEIGPGPAGIRVVYEVASAVAKGDRFRAAMEGPLTGDWLIIGPEGTATLDVRATLRTDDDALVLVQFQGRADVSQGIQPPVTVYVAPRFETADPRYAWLNRVQAAGKGVVHEDFSIDYEWYELR